MAILRCFSLQFNRKDSAKSDTLNKIRRKRRSNGCAKNGTRGLWIPVQQFLKAHVHYKRVDFLLSINLTNPAEFFCRVTNGNQSVLCIKTTKNRSPRCRNSETNSVVFSEENMFYTMQVSLDNDSRAWFWSTDHCVMVSACFHCTTLLILTINYLMER